MKKQIIVNEQAPEPCPSDLEDEDDWDKDYVSEHEKESYIKHIRLNLTQYRTYCPSNIMATAIGGEFTGALVADICADPKRPVKTFKRNGKQYVAIAPFLEKLKKGLTFEDIQIQR